MSHSQFIELLRVFGDLLAEPLSRRIDLASYASKLTEQANICFAFANHQVVGLQALYTNDRETSRAFLPFLSVLPSYQGRGIGAVMLSRAMACARQRGMIRLALEVKSNNFRAQAFYQSQGFRFARRDGASSTMEFDLTGLTAVNGVSPTPVERAPGLAAALGLEIDLRLKRDDLFPMPGGGIKARKINYIVRHAIEHGFDALVTNGGPQSNHARAAATVAANFGLKCHLIVGLRPGEEYPSSGNLLLMKLSGASIEYCEKHELAERMDRAMERFTAKGHKPLYVWGGGHCHEGTVACVDAAHEAMQQCGDWCADFVIAAAGTGGTQAGLALGYAPTRSRVIGISVARSKERGQRIVHGCIDEYFQKACLPVTPVDVDFRDDWIDGGYEQYSPELFATIERAAKSGVFFCPTYTGKALRGLVELARRGEIKPDSRVLFWHTGGLLNLQAVKKYAEQPVSL